MKGISFEHIKLQKGNDYSEYSMLVDQTAKLLKRPWIAVHRMVESWPLSKIRDRLNEATKHNGKLPPAVYWFWKRKKDKELSTPLHNS